MKQKEIMREIKKHDKIQNNNTLQKDRSQMEQNKCVYFLRQKSSERGDLTKKKLQR